MVLPMSQIANVAFFRKQVLLENKIVKAAKESVKEIDNALVHELILGVALDSKKHSMMLSALVGKYTKPTPLLAENLTEKLRKKIDEHIRLEQEAVDTYRELLKRIEDNSERIVIDAIIHDEIEHHELLKRIHKMIVEKETLAEKDLWDMIWKDSPFHGSPGGG